MHLVGEASGPPPDRPCQGKNGIGTIRVHGIRWELGDEFVGAVIARGDLFARNYLEEDLEIEPTLEPHPLHANVNGWPEEKQKRIFIAKNLADKAVLYIRKNTQ
ncbi:MAG: hypothetical protein ACE5GO_10545 [Anaerolineales bacterium]